MPITEGGFISPRAERLIREATGQAHAYCARHNISGDAALQHLIGRLESVIRVLGAELERKTREVTL